MSARKKVNQSRPRALARGDALAVAGAVCFNAASDGRPTSARRSSRPPSNSSASADSPCLRRRRGITASVFGRMPLASDLPHSPGYSKPPSLSGGSIAVCSYVLKYAMAAILRSAVVPREFAIRKKFQSSKPLRYGTLALKCHRAAYGGARDSSRVHLVTQSRGGR